MVAKTQRVTKTQTPIGSPEPIKVARLAFDAKNTRIKEATREIGGTLSPDDILEVLWREFAVDEIALSIAANGYFEYEPLFAAQEDGQLVVIEGNRRLAAVKLLLDPQARRRVGATDLPVIGDKLAEALKTLPVIIADRAAVWEYIGFKHVNGPQAWQSLAKAEYIAWVHNTLGIQLGDIARHIGDQHATVRRLYRALMALEQVEESGTFGRADRWRKHFSFSHLYTGLDYANIQKFCGVAGDGSFRQRPVPRSKLKEFGELCVWLYGSRAKDRQPLIQSQNPDLRILDEVLGSRDGVAALRQNLPLRVSFDISKGDERLFREAMVASKQSLAEARGRLLTGYDGERDLLRMGEDIRDLAADIHQGMEDIYYGTRRAKRPRAQTSPQRERSGNGPTRSRRSAKPTD